MVYVTQVSQQRVLFGGLRACMAIATGVSEGKKVLPRMPDGLRHPVCMQAGCCRGTL